MITIYRIKSRDFWLVPPTMLPGEWRVTNKRRNPGLTRPRKHRNMFAVRQIARLFDYSEPYFEYTSDEYWDDDRDGSLEYWAGDVPEPLCDHCPDRNICLDLGCELE